jgi:hypothetical protein
MMLSACTAASLMLVTATAAMAAPASRPEPIGCGISVTNPFVANDDHVKAEAVVACDHSVHKIELKLELSRELGPNFHLSEALRTKTELESDSAILDAVSSGHCVDDKYMAKATVEVIFPANFEPAIIRRTVTKSIIVHCDL